MRIRQVKPSFWTDKTMALLSYPARLFYVGLWCVADDAGWLEWDVDELGALLFPHEQPRRRAKHMEAWAVELVAAGRIKLLDCGCAVIPTLDVHQKHAGGTRSYTQRTMHERRHFQTSPDKSVDGDTVGNGRERKGRVGNGSARPRDEIKINDEEKTTSEFQSRVPRP